MNFCPHCGSSVGLQDTNCPKCGRSLVAEEDASGKKGAALQNRSLKKTVIGIIGPSAAAEAMGNAAGRAASKPTLVGMPAASPAAPADVAAEGAKAGPAHASNEANSGGAAPAPGGRPAGPKTMIGIPAPANANALPDAGVARPRPAGAHIQTIVGLVAPQGPRPTAEAKESPTPDHNPVHNEQASLPLPLPPLEFEPGFLKRVAAAESARSYQSAGIAIGGGLVLATAAAAFAIFWRSPAPLRAEARVDATGNDVLHMTCSTCPDGTVLRIGASHATVTDQGAEVSLPTPLKVGDNVFMVEVDRPANGRDETVPLVVKIGYRIRPDPSQLDSDSPKLRVIIDGAPHSAVTMGGVPLTIGDDGSANYDLDISTDCMGTTDEAKTIERSIPYSVGGSTGAAEQGVVSLRVAVPPLRVDSPGARSVVQSDHVQLSGRTGRGAKLLAGDQLIGVAADGSFSRSLPLPILGSNEVKLRAQVPGQAPRIAMLRVKRVENLTSEAREFAAQARLSFSALMQDVSQHVGEPVSLSGEIVEARLQGARTLALLDVKGCAAPPCLARVIAAGEDLARGDTVTVYGYVNGTVGQGDAGSPIAEIEASFTIKNR